MSVGDTHTIQALSAAGTSVTGLTWASSNPNVVSLSTDDPPVLTALAAGHVTIIAGTAPNAASADVTVWVGALPLGTVIWSNPGDGSGVSWIVPAVPSTTGVADVFAIQNDGTVQAITSDGTTAWAANISQNQASYYWGPGYVLPDFQGGLVVVGNYDPDTGAASVWKLDGITGQPYPAYTAPGYGADGGGTILCPGAEGWVGGACAAVHPDGTIFAVQENVAVSYDPNLPITRTYSLIGIDPATGAQKFNVPGTSCIPDAECIAFGVMIAGDGYAYLGYEWSEFPNPELLYPFVRHLMVLRVDSSGDYQNIDVSDYTSGGLDFAPLFPYMITNADQGILLTWNNGGKGMATITGGSLSPVSSPLGSQFVPVLQAQDGSFVGITGQDCSVGYGGMVSFDAAGNVRWIVPNDCPQIATADGGVIGQSGITYDQNGNATGQVVMAAQSWTMNEYLDGPVTQLALNPYLFALSYWPFPEGNDSGNGSANLPIDSIANAAVKKILTPQRWQKFAGSNCSAVFKKGLPLPFYSMQVIQTKQGMTNYYDTSNPGVGDLTELQVTGGHYGTNVTLTNYLANGGGADAATLNMGYDRQTAVIMKHMVLTQKYPEFDLIHETVLHAYAAQWDDPIFGNSVFQQSGLWRPSGSTATANISTWMSTDCTCTPGNPATPKCKADTAKW